MAQLVWDSPGSRVYEAGVSNGVLYVDGADGVAWNGLIAVNESPNGGQITPYYIDGIRYLNRAGIEEFEGTIEAFTYPDEFEPCVGVVAVSHGLFAMHQQRKPFGLAYMTRVGTDLDPRAGYKFHIIYNAMVEPSNRSNKTMGDGIDPLNFSWKIVTKPPAMVGYKPTSHFVIDSRETPKDLLNQIFNIMFGSQTTAPRLPSVAELLDVFNSFQASSFDGGADLLEEFFNTIDAGIAGTPYDSFIDGGGA
jgi:hypothetical protein